VRPFRSSGGVVVETVSAAPAADAAPAPGRLGAWSASHRWRQWIAATGLGGGAFILLLFPLGCFLLLAFSPRLFHQGTQWLSLSSFSGAFTSSALQGLMNTGLVGVGAALLAVGIALPMTWALLRTSLAGRRVFTVLTWTLLLLPTFLAASGLEVVAQQNGPLSWLVGHDPSGLRRVVMGPVGVVWVLACRGVPFAYLALAGSIRSLGGEYEEAARVHGARPWVAVRIRFWLLAPAILAALAIVFAESISDFGVASTLAANAQFPLATYTVYSSVSTLPVDFGTASAESWLLLAMVALAVLGQQRASRGRTFAVISGRTRFEARRALRPATQIVGALGVAVFFAVSVGIPVLGIVATSMTPPLGTGGGLTFANYARVLHDPTLVGPIRFSVQIALLCASFAMLLGTGAAWFVSRKGASRVRAGLDTAMLAAIGLPSIVVASGFLFAYNLPFLGHLGIQIYGTNIVLAMGYLAGFTPIVARLMAGPLAQVSDNLRQAARVHGAGALRSWRRVVVPMLAPSLLSAWLFVFSAVVFELPLSDVLHPAGTEPLAVAITKQMRFDTAGGTAETVLAALVILVIVGICLGLYRMTAPAGWRRSDHAGADRPPSGRKWSQSRYRRRMPAEGALQ
jgi:iron(III) transport system permease protein